MARVGFSMQLKPGNEVEYKKRHDEIWPELHDLLKEAGIRNYSIYRQGLTLFGYLEIDDPSAPGAAPGRGVDEEMVAIHGAPDGVQRGLVAEDDHP